MQMINLLLYQMMTIKLVLERVAVRQFLFDPLKVGTEKHQRISMSPPLAICRGTYLGVVAVRSACFRILTVVQLETNFNL